MNCPHCHSSSTTEREGRTVHGFRCWQCGRRYNKRTGTALNRGPSDIVFLFWRLRYKLSLRDLAEVFLVRGTVFTHEACGIGDARLAPLLVEASPWGSGRLRPGHRFCRQCPPLPARDIRALFIDRRPQ